MFVFVQIIYKLRCGEKIRLVTETISYSVRRSFMLV